MSLESTVLSIAQVTLLDPAFIVVIKSDSGEKQETCMVSKIGMHATFGDNMIYCQVQPGEI